jgi:hypothetical protein
MTKRQALSSGLLLLGLFWASPASAQLHVERLPDGDVSVHALDVPVTALLSELAKHNRLEIRLDPSVGNRLITLDIERATVVAAVLLVAKESGADYVVSGSRVVIGDLGSAGQLGEAQTVPRDESSGADASPRELQPEPAAQPLEDTPAEDADGPARSAVVVIGQRPVAERGPGPGEVNGAEILRLITPPTGAPAGSGPVELPFRDERGQPIVVMRDGAAKSLIELPFPDDMGRSLVVPAVGLSVPPGWVALPFPGPDGQQLLVPVVPPETTVAPPVRPPGR